MRTFLVSDLDPGLDDASLRGSTITVYGSLDEAERVWRRAVEACACYVFQTFEWNKAWRDTIGSVERVAERIVHVCAADGRTLLLLPLGVYDHRHFSSLQFLGGIFSDYNAPIIDRAFARDVAADVFGRLWRVIVDLMPSVDLVCLVRMPQTIEKIANPMLGLPEVTRSGTGYAARLPASFGEFAGVRSAGFFRQNRSRWRRLAKLGEVELSLATGREERIAITRLAGKQKSQWLAQRGLPDLFRRQEVGDFYRLLTGTPLQDGEISVAALRVGGRIVATMWAPIFRGRYYFLLASYDQAWSQYSVGRLLMEQLVQWCIGQPHINVFDLTVGNEDYKLFWSDHTIALHQHLDARTLKGAVVAAYRRGRTHLANSGRVRSLVANIRRARASMAGNAR